MDHELSDEECQELQKMHQSAFSSVQIVEDDEGGRVATGLRMHVWLPANEYTPQRHRRVLDLLQKVHCNVQIDGILHRIEVGEENILVEVYVGSVSAAASFTSFAEYVDSEQCLRDLVRYEIPSALAAPPSELTQEADAA